MAFSVMVLKSFLESAERLDLSRDDLLCGSLADCALERDGAWIDSGRFYEIVRRALRVSGDPALGLHIGERGNFTALGPAGLLFSIVPTFREAMEAMSRFHDVARDEQDIFLSTEGQLLVVEYRLFDATAEARRCIAEIVLALMAGLLRQFAGARGVARRVLFDYPAPAHTAEYERIFGCEVRFDEPRVALLLDLELAAREQLLSQPELAADLRQRAEVRQANRLYPRTLVGRVRYHLRENWLSGAPSMDAVARQLGMSQRSLHRHLAREGIDYRTVLNEARCEHAARLLSGGGASVKQVAGELGFSSSSAFHRAFKRWMGCSPSEYASSRRALDAASAADV